MSESFLLAGTGLSLLVGYLMGSVSFAVVVSHLMGLRDPRSFGSGNPGATNVLRGGNKLAALLTLVGDAAKGWLAVWLATWGVAQAWLPEAAIPLAGLGAFLGHLYPVFLRFHGGKGVATALGVLLGLQPWLALATALTWIIIAFVTRYSSLAAIIAAVFAPFYYVLGDKVAWHIDALTASVIVAISVLLLARHHENIARLIAGKESRIGGKKKSGS
ncbi:glycerol-3-phosphate 1-O-acyltransferase PlsY [Castellaniella caeni]|uniref:glycerol-3-phosphate 1-O-acyltransferase PlsY n=1 Tax=Castellaniella caeni TaxID=266123 RepID=UPI0008324FE3|nr:glycerol-3-phosphate 1-O-acyltransferase PlsY [Castellaniella caeni]